MRVSVHTKYGSPDVLRLMDVERPVPKDDTGLRRHGGLAQVMVREDWRGPVCGKRHQCGPTGDRCAEERGAVHGDGG